MESCNDPGVYALTRAVPGQALVYWVHRTLGKRRRQWPWNTVSGNVQDRIVEPRGKAFLNLTLPLEGASISWKLHCLCPDRFLINSSGYLRAQETGLQALMDTDPQLLYLDEAG